VAPVARGAATALPGAQPVQAAAVIVDRMDQVAQVQFADGMSALELDTALAVSVVEHELVVAAATEFFAANAPLRGAVAVTGAGRGCTVPQRPVAARQVALRRNSVIVGRAEDRRVAVLFALAARARQRAAFALAVVQRADDQRPVDIVFKELHQYFLADAPQELAAHAATGRALCDAHPAGRVGVFLPVEANAYPAQAVAMDFISAARARPTISAHYDRAVAVRCSRLKLAVVYPVCDR
jgi:hypothetical protein